MRVNLSKEKMMQLNQLSKPLVIMLVMSGFALTSMAAERERTAPSTTTTPPEQRRMQSDTAAQTGTKAQTETPTKMSQMSTNILRISEIIGVTVENPQGDNLGEINDVVVDPSNGNVAYAVLAAGGFLGLGEKLFAIPWGAFQTVADDDDKTEIERLILETDKDRMQNAPGFDKDNWPDMANPEWGQTVHTYYGQQDYWQQRQSRQSAQSSTAMNERMISATVQQVQGTTVELEVPQDLVQDLQAGDRVEVSVQKKVTK
jgi:sporulation protein YlmC with PRC-barrel domain